MKDNLPLSIFSGSVAPCEIRLMISTEHMHDVIISHGDTGTRGHGGLERTSKCYLCPKLTSLNFDVQSSTFPRSTFHRWFVNTQNFRIIPASVPPRSDSHRKTRAPPSVHWLGRSASRAPRSGSQSAAAGLPSHPPWAHA